MPDFEPIDDTTHVYRVIKKSWIDQITGEILPDAYLLKDETECEPGNGLSVIICKEPPTLEEAEKYANLTKVYGVEALSVYKIRALGLDVIQDAEHHAYITGLPFKDNDLIAANILADKLAQNSFEVVRKTVA